MNMTQDSATSGQGGVEFTAAIDGQCVFHNQEKWFSDEQKRKRRSIHSDLKIEVERLACSTSPAAPMHLLVGDPYRIAASRINTTRQDASSVGTDHFKALPTHWTDHAGTTRRTSHVGLEDLGPAERALSPEPKPLKPMFKSTDFNLGQSKSVTMSVSSAAIISATSGSQDMSRRRTEHSAHGGHSVHAGHSVQAGQSSHAVNMYSARPPIVPGPGMIARRDSLRETSTCPRRDSLRDTSTSSLGSSPARARPSSAKTRDTHLAEDSGSIRSQSSLGLSSFVRRQVQKGKGGMSDDYIRSQLNQLEISNLRALAASRTPDEIKQMATVSRIHGNVPDDMLGFSTSGRSKSRTSNVSGSYLTMKYSPAQMGFDGYGGPASLPEDIDEMLNRHGQNTDEDLKLDIRETLRSKTASPAIKEALRALPLRDGFINPASLKILKEKTAQASVPFCNTKSPVVSKHDLIIEKAQDNKHDTPSYKKHACGFNMRGETLVYSWAAPHNFRGQYSNPRIHAPGRPPAVHTSEKAKFKGFVDDPEKMRTLSENIKADCVYEGRSKGVRLCGDSGVGFYPIPAGGGRPSRDVKHKVESAEAYHKYLNPDLLKMAQKKNDISREPELVFPKTTLILDEKTWVASNEEPKKGVWRGAPDLYPGDLVPSTTRYRFLFSPGP
jgi:hypothetical protein